MPNNETMNEENKSSQETAKTEGVPAELIKAVHHNGIVALKTYFEDVEGWVMNQQIFGPIFVFRVKDEENNAYECGFFLQELIAKFQSGKDPSQWMASFFFEMMKTPGGKALPVPPANEAETKTLVDRVIIPYITGTIQSEFAPAEVHTGLDIHKDYGPVYEAGFPSIREGSNTCAAPIAQLIAHHLLNRDPADVLLHSLHLIKESNGNLQG